MMEHRGSVNDIEGRIYFDTLTVGAEYVLDVVIPNGFKLASESPDTVPLTFTFDGTPLQLDIWLEEE